MTTYLTFNDVQSCVNNSLINEGYPFNLNRDKTITVNPSYNNYPNQSNPMKILDIMDTFHDLAKDRGENYDSDFFKEWIANYLMTGQWVEGDNIDFYKSMLNYPEYSAVKGYSSFENRVDMAFELKHGLQPSEITITYDDILKYFLIPKKSQSGSDILIIEPSFKQKIIESNGSIIIKPSLSQNMSFDTYKSNLLEIIKDQTTVNKYMLKIAFFIKWYLHSSDFILGNDGTIPIQNQSELFVPSIPNEIRFVFDAVNMNEIFDIEGSGGTPYIGAFTVMDSASTSTNLLDPLMQIEYEIMPTTASGDGMIVPFFSNYFSCEETFIGYLQNPGKKFGSDGIFCFSLVMFKIPNPDDDNNVREACIYVKNIDPYVVEDGRYIEAQTVITNYVYANPSKMVRYFFGEVERNMSEESACGTCGAGVPYLGKVFKQIELAMKKIKEITGQIAYQSDINYPTIVNLFDALKKVGDLKQRIPIADARILKLFFQSVGIAVTEQDMLLLYKILADYKRSGDYQQVYAVLKAILFTGTNTGCYTHATGDELAALLARMLGLPCVYQVSSIGKNVLYRCPLYMVDATRRQQQLIEDKIKTTTIFFTEFNSKIITIFNFLQYFYSKVCILKKQLIEIIEKSNIQTIDKIALFNAYFMLDKLIKLSNLLLTDENIKVLQTYVSVYKGLSTSNFVIRPEELDQYSSLIQQISVIPFSELINYIQQYFPNLSSLNDTSTSTSRGEQIFEPFTKTEYDNGTFIRPNLDLHFKKTQSTNDKIRKFREFITTILPSSSESDNGSRSSRRKQTTVGMYIDETKKKRIVDTFNAFVANLNIGDNYFVSSLNDISKDISTKVNSIFEYQINKYKDEQNSNCLDSGKLIEILNSLLVSNGLSGGGSLYESKNESQNITLLDFTQKGGMISPIQLRNRKVIYMKIKKTVLSLFQKCNNYLLDVTNNTKINFTGNMDGVLLNIYNVYDVNNFCKYLLYGDSSDENDTVYNGILIELENISNDYTSDDINDDGNDTPLSSMQVLNLLGLNDIKMLLYLLSVNIYLTAGTNVNVYVSGTIEEINTNGTLNILSDNGLLLTDIPAQIVNYLIPGSIVKLTGPTGSLVTQISNDGQSLQIKIGDGSLLIVPVIITYPILGSIINVSYNNSLIKSTIVEINPDGTFNIVDEQGAKLFSVPYSSIILIPGSTVNIYETICSLTQINNDGSVNIFYNNINVVNVPSAFIIPIIDSNVMYSYNGVINTVNGNNTFNIQIPLQNGQFTSQNNVSPQFIRLNDIPFVSPTGDNLIDSNNLDSQTLCSIIGLMPPNSVLPTFNQFYIIIAYTMLYNSYNGFNSFIGNNILFKELYDKIYVSLLSAPTNLPQFGLSTILDESFLKGTISSIRSDSIIETPSNPYNIYNLLTTIFAKMTSVFGINIAISRGTGTRSAISSSSSLSSVPSSSSSLSISPTSSPVNPYKKFYPPKPRGGKKTKKNRKRKTYKKQKTYKKINKKNHQKTYKKINKKNHQKTYKKINKKIKR